MEDDYGLRKQMWFTQQAESIGLSIRNKMRLKRRLKLLEAQVNIERVGSNEQVFLLKAYRELLGDEFGLNVDFVEPFFQKSGFGHWERSGKVIGRYRIGVQLCTIVTPKNELEADQKQEYQDKMAEEKKQGTYNENTYKKYK